jgi:hypothetical protein
MNQQGVDMQNQYIRGLLESVAISSALVCIAVVIWFLKRDTGNSFQDILFWVSISPIVFFSIGQLGGNISESDTGFQKSKSLFNQSTGSVAISKFRESRYDLKFIVAGVLSLLFSMTF